MKYPIRRLPKYHIAYALLPYKRNQDVIRVEEFGEGNYSIAVVDGWNSQDMFPDDYPGREVATIVANEYPALFHLGGKETIVSVGDAETYLWNGSTWYKPKEISDHWLDFTIYESNVSRFFGSSKHKADPRFPGIFSAQPDVLEIKPGIPVIFATDGVKDVLPITDLNTLPVDPIKHSAKEIVKTILDEVTRRGTQRDDISVLVRV